MNIRRIAEAKLTKQLLGREALLLLGARQVGKTTLINQVLSGKKAVFLNLDFEQDKQKLLALSAMSADDVLTSLNHPDFLIIDEAQRLPETGRIIKAWFDKKLPFKSILLGSSSLNILDQSAESLTGRNSKYYLPPLLFWEIVEHADWYLSKTSDKQLITNFGRQIDALLDENLLFGNYPKVVTSSNKAELLRELTADYLFKDIYQLGLVRDPELIRRLLMLLALQLGSEVSVNELANNLNVARPTIDRYLDLLEKTYIIFRLPAFSTNSRKEISKSQKIYFYDTGIRNALINDFSAIGFRSDIGQLWENWVVSELYKQNLVAGDRWGFYFWRSHSGGEVDLVLKKDDKLRAYEIKWQSGRRSRTNFNKLYNARIEVINRSDPIVKL